jgi:hypothetical protein
VSQDKIVFWDNENAELLGFETLNEYVESFLDGVDEKDTPETIIVCGYAREKLPSKNSKDFKWDAESVLENLIERLDEDYGGEDYTEMTNEMKEKAEKFVAEIYKLYPVWRCKIVKKEIVNTKEWIAKNRPDWLREG